MGDGEDGAQKAKKIIEDVRDGRVCKEIENMALQGIQVLEAHQGRILCTFVIPNTLVEEVEIEAKVLGHTGKLTAMVVEIRKKSNGEMIALGQQWTSSVSTPESLVSKL
ncbi:hypothetical protein Scep_007339 [Stephania cephalantha]|uniref:Uncharacterized protein n=1 Tax=Stephania cephalantha TaxID=152367 RepID=A0AAP0PLP8_9MAGN